jgi:hypothetical protein
MADAIGQQLRREIRARADRARKTLVEFGLLPYHSARSQCPSK